MLDASNQSTKGRTTAEFELKLLTAGALVEEERRATALLEGMALALLGIGIIATIKACAQLGVGKYLVRLVDRLHLLLSCLLGEALLVRLVRVMLLGQLAVGALDLSLVGVAGHAEDLVVVLGLAAAQFDLRLAQQRLHNRLLVGRDLGGSLEGADRGLVVLGFL